MASPLDWRLKMNCNYWLAAALAETEYEAKLHNSALLGCSPAELEHGTPELRSVSLVDHQGSPEMDLTNVVGEW